MNVTIVNYRPALPDDISPVRALFDIQLEANGDCITIQDAKIVKSKKGLKVFLPTVKHKGKFTQVCRVDNTELFWQIEKAALTCYRKE